MAQRGTDPDGTLRCGCGATVRIEANDRPQCSSLTEPGRQCALVPVRDAAAFGLSLCGEHFAILAERFEEAFAEREAKLQEDAAGLREVLAMHARNAQESRAEVAAARTARDEAATWYVYYVRIGDRIKIGTSGNIKSRIASLMPDEVLATEPGGREIETLRHRQFAALRVRGERFQPGPELLSHIAMIREHFGEPVITV